MIALAALGGAGCAHDVPSDRGASAPRLGRAPEGFRPALACTAWRSAVGFDRDASSHTTFAELFPSESCFVAVTHGVEGVRAGPTPAQCGFPSEVARSRATLLARAEVYERVAGGDVARLPIELACPLSPAVRSAAARSNAATLRRLAALDAPRAYPYAAVATFGYGTAAQDTSPLVGRPPGAACVPLDGAAREALGVNLIRAARAAAAYHGGVAPTITVSGGAVHAALVEAFALEHLLRCEHGVPPDRILVDPCADHTHTNVRNTGALVIGLGARTAYVVTDPFLQSDYLGDFTFFDAIGGSVDQRSLRDFGHLLGAWRRASRGIEGGFWFTPYRFWNDPSVRDLSCEAP